MTKRAKRSAVFACILASLLLTSTSALPGETHLNLGLELSGHLIPYLGISYMSGVDEVGFNLGAALPHDGSLLDISNYGYQGTVYYRYNFINMDIYPGVQLKTLLAPSSSDSNELLVMVGGSIRYLYSPGEFRFGGGVELNLGLPISALDGFSFPIPYLSLETSYEFE